eukprot:TRINITY_DN7713_c1_g1_i2.p1 TRINITY_DN7713_c1_g1~~TRINITY_DN7713_c1_g1_i2.p1  ORF type:complete len:811 (-),score=203.45 TRINITY_DN7713_c1_g1_i2:87-2483(-)
MAPKKKADADAKAKAKAKTKAKAKAKDDVVVESTSSASFDTAKSLKEGFDAQANSFGYVNVTDKKAMKSFANFLNLDEAVVAKEMKALDFDANNLISFAEFVLWADKHTVGIPLGIGVPDKRVWRKGMPDHWTSIPPPDAAEEAALAAASAASKGGGGIAAAVGAAASYVGGAVSSLLKGSAAASPEVEVELEEDPDTSELEDLISAAKEQEWNKVWKILKKHPLYVNMRPPHRKYAAIHQAAYGGNVKVCQKIVENFRGDPALKTKDGQTPEEVATENGNSEAAAFLAEAAHAWAGLYQPPKKKFKRGPDVPEVAETGHEALLLKKANQAIDFAKWEQWKEMFDVIASCPACQNVRPEYRAYGVIHQAAYSGDVDVLRKLVEGGADSALLTQDKKTPLQVAESEGNLEASKYLETLKVAGGIDDVLIREAHNVIDAAKDGDWERTIALLSASPNPEQLVNTRPAVRLYGVLHQAAFHGDIEILRKLLEDFKANVKLLTKDGQTALQIAQSCDQQAAVEYLEACTPSIKLGDDFVKYPEQTFVTVTDKEVLKRIGDLIEKTHKKSCNWTRDRDRASGEFVSHTPVPTGYELVGVVRNENPALWRIYQVSREVTRLNCAKDIKEAPFKSWQPMTMDIKSLDFSDWDYCKDSNEWLLWHASLPEALSAIARTGFTMAKLGSGGTTGGGGLYGDGTYFADSITKADEYARRKVEKGEFKGCRAAAICRVLGGRHFYTDKDVMEKDKPKFAKRVLEGHYSSTVGDRLKLKNSFREYVVYDASATYLEYVVYYRRKGVPKKHE